MEEYEWKQFMYRSSQLRPPSTATCVICMDEYFYGDKITRLACQHYFHCGCIHRWLSRNRKCPICRQAVAVPAKVQPSSLDGHGRLMVQHVRVSSVYYRRPHWLWIYQLMELVESLFFTSN